MYQIPAHTLDFMVYFIKYQRTLLETFRSVVLKITN